MVEYDHTLTPPAPVAKVTLGSDTTDAKVEGLRMILDSGADDTVLPTDAVDRLGITYDENPTHPYGTFNGETVHLPLVKATVTFDGVDFIGEFPVCATMADGVIGRDILNTVILELHGPLCKWTTRAT